MNQAHSPSRRVAVVAESTAAGPSPALLDALRDAEDPAHHYELLAPGPDAVRAALALRPFDVVLLADAGPSSVSALAVARGRGLPLVTLYDDIDGARQLHAAAHVVLSPGDSADAKLTARGVSPQRVQRWLPGVDPEQFHPARFAPDAFGPTPQDEHERRIHLLYAGRPGDSAGLELLADAFRAAQEHCARLQLVLAGGGPVPARLRLRLGAGTTVLGECSSEELARAFASADLLIVPGPGEPFGESILAAQASGLPVLALAGAAAEELIESGRSGLLIGGGRAELSESIGWLARRATLRERLATGGLQAVRGRSWERSRAELGAAIEQALAPAPEVVCAA